MRERPQRTRWIIGALAVAAIAVSATAAAGAGGVSAKYTVWGTIRHS